MSEQQTETGSDQHDYDVEIAAAVRVVEAFPGAIWEKVEPGAPES